LQAGGHRFDPDKLHHLFGGAPPPANPARRWWKTEYPKREIKVCIGSFEPDACSDYIVKRRYVWKLPGVEDGRKVI
jgi:hypothetical protein